MTCPTLIEEIPVSRSSKEEKKNTPGIIYPQPNYLETELNIPFRQNRFL
jgi:hypothetical protein